MDAVIGWSSGNSGTEQEGGKGEPEKVRRKTLQRRSYSSNERTLGGEKCVAVRKASISAGGQ